MPSAAINFKRKNIDLPVETLQKLSLMAVAQGKSLKAYIESILISKADSVSIEVKINPSPSNDEWFANQDNLNLVEKGIQDVRDGKVKAYSIHDIQKMLDV